MADWSPRFLGSVSSPHYHCCQLNSVSQATFCDALLSIIDGKRGPLSVWQMFSTRMETGGQWNPAFLSPSLLRSSWPHPPLLKLYYTSCHSHQLLNGRPRGQKVKTHFGGALFFKLNHALSSQYRRRTQPLLVFCLSGSSALCHQVYQTFTFGLISSVLHSFNLSKNNAKYLSCKTLHEVVVAYLPKFIIMA